MGVLGAANIARKVVIPSIVRAEGVELAAIASESTKAADFLEQTDLQTADGIALRESARACTYEEVLADAPIDAVNTHRPNTLHPAAEQPARPVVETRGGCREPRALREAGGADTQRGRRDGRALRRGARR